LTRLPPNEVPICQQTTPERSVSFGDLRGVDGQGSPTGAKDYVVARESILEMEGFDEFCRRLETAVAFAADGGRGADSTLRLSLGPTRACREFSGVRRRNVCGQLFVEVIEMDAEIVALQRFRRRAWRNQPLICDDRADFHLHGARHAGRRPA